MTDEQPIPDGRAAVGREAHEPRVTGRSARLLVRDAFAKLKAEIERTHPGLAEGGVGGWQEFNAVFGEGHRAKGAKG